MNYETQRLLICELGRRMWQKGWLAANDGNLSRRLGEGLFLITPAGVSKGFLSPEMLVVVDRDGNVAEPGGYAPSSETPLHMECYRRRPDVGGVCHAHSPAATAFACARYPIASPVLGEAVMTLGPVPCAPYGRTGTADLPAAAGPFLETYDAVLLANHGAVTMGSDLEQAYFRMETVEHAALVHLYARTLGGGIPLPAEEVRALAANKDR